MFPIPEKVKEKIILDNFYKQCSRSNKDCQGRITWEHVWIYAGKQIQEVWSIIPLCEFHHAVNDYQNIGKLNKEINQWISINRMTEEDELKYPAIKWKIKRNYLNKKYAVL